MSTINSGKQAHDAVANASESYANRLFGRAA